MEIKKQGADLGKISIKVISGTLIRNTEAFGKMDPFVMVEYNGQKQRTKTIHDSSTNPVWNETFEFEIQNKDKKLQVYCYDEDIASNDELGVGSLDIQKLLSSSPKQHTLKLLHDSKLASEILLETKFIESEAPKLSSLELLTMQVASSSNDPFGNAQGRASQNNPLTDQLKPQLQANINNNDLRTRNQIIQQRIKEFAIQTSKPKLSRNQPLSILSSYGLNSIHDLIKEDTNMYNNLIMKTLNCGIFQQGGFLEVTIFKGKLYARKDVYYPDLDKHWVILMYEGRKYYSKIESFFEMIGKGQYSLQEINPIMIPIIFIGGELRFFYCISQNEKDLVGKGSININSLCSKFRTKKWLPVFNYLEEKTGEILFESRYLPPPNDGYQLPQKVRLSQQNQEDIDSYLLKEGSPQQYNTNQMTNYQIVSNSPNYYSHTGNNGAPMGQDMLRKR